MKRLPMAVAILTACAPAGRGSDDDPVVPTSDAPPVAEVSLVYAHSGGTLYRMDPFTLAATPIGAMTGIGTQNLLDLAVDKTDRLVGITRDKLYSLSPTSGAATLIQDLSAAAQDVTSLSFVPG